MELADHDFYIDAKVALISKNFDYPSARILCCAGPVCNLDVNNYLLQVFPSSAARSFLSENTVHRGVPLAAIRRCWPAGGGLTRELLARRNHDILRDLFVHWSNVVVTISVMESSNHSGMGTADDANDTAFGTPIGSDCSHFYQYSIAMHSGTDRRRRDEDVTAEHVLQRLRQRLWLWDDKAVSVSMHGQPAD